MMFSACSDDDEDINYPSAVTELAEVTTDADSLVKNITTDSGRSFVPQQPITAYAPDTLLRCLCMYQEEKGHTAVVYQLAGIVSARPVDVQKLKETPQDPVTVISSWNTARYINVYFSMRTTGVDKHGLGFCDDGITTETDGTRIAHIRLLHKRPEKDAESYSQKSYVSLPAYLYEGQADSIAFSIQTYDGTFTKGFRF